MFQSNNFNFSTLEVLLVKALSRDNPIMNLRTESVRRILPVYILLFICPKRFILKFANKNPSVPEMFVGFPPHWNLHHLPNTSYDGVCSLYILSQGFSKSALASRALETLQTVQPYSDVPTVETLCVTDSVIGV